MLAAGRAYRYTIGMCAIRRFWAGLLALLLGTALSAAGWETLAFDLPSESRESLWRDALARHLGGATEVRTSVGRADVATAAEVVEVDELHHWKEGMGQALAYAGATGKKPVLALTAYARSFETLSARNRERIRLADAECARRGVRLLILYPQRPALPPRSEDRPETPAAKGAAS